MVRSLTARQYEKLEQQATPKRSFQKAKAKQLDRLDGPVARPRESRLKLTAGNGFNAPKRYTGKFIREETRYLATRREFVRSILIKDVRCGGALVCDHVWMKTVATLASMATGQTIEFDATVRKYRRKDLTRDVSLELIKIIPPIKTDSL